MTTLDRNPEDMIPLTEPVYHILLALMGKTLYGYGIMLQIKSDTEGRLDLTTGTLYNALKRLKRSELIKEVPPPVHVPKNDRQGRYYELTDFGQRVLVAEYNRLNRMVTLGGKQGLTLSGSAFGLGDASYG